MALSDLIEKYETKRTTNTDFIRTYRKVPSKVEIITSKRKENALLGEIIKDLKNLKRSEDAVNELFQPLFATTPSVLASRNDDIPF